MDDENFQRTVVLLVEHSAEGSLGFVLNRRLEIPLSELVKELPLPGVPIYLGGPVENTTLHYIHRLETLPGARKVGDGVYWSGSFEILSEMINTRQLDPDEIVFFVGYSGWGAGQLDQELARKSWIVAPGDMNVVFQADQSDLWRQLLQTLGPKYKVISNYPVDPKLN